MASWRGVITLVNKTLRSEDLPAFIDITLMAEIMGISRSTAFSLAKSEGFPAIRVGAKRIIVPADKFLKWIDDQAEKPMALYRVR
jgi:predicted DNA-binding transcriptional regulator AlpA